MTIATALPEPMIESLLAYHFVCLDEAGYCLSEGPLLLEDDKEAIAHATRILAGAMLVAIYQDGRKVSTLAKLC